MPIDIDKDVDQSSGLESGNNENNKVIEHPYNNGFTYFVPEEDSMETKKHIYSEQGAYDIDKYSNIQFSTPENNIPDHVDDIKNLRTKELNSNIMRVREGNVDDYLKNLAKDEMDDIRSDTIFIEALKYGTQSALYYRSYQVNKFLSKYADKFDGTFVFQPLLMSQGRVVPPVILEGQNSFFQEGDQKYTEVNKTFKIHKQAKIVNSPLTWRTYVNFSPSKPSLPDKMSLPLNKKEDDIWKKGVEKGWELGLKQANNIFKQQIKNLEIDYVGMVRYHLLLKAGIVNNPVTSTLNLGINKNEETINIGETAFEITRLPDFNTNTETWEALPEIENFINIDNI